MAFFTQKGSLVVYEIEREGGRVVKRILGLSEPRSFVLELSGEAEARRRYYELIGELIDLGWERQTSPEEELMPLCCEPAIEALIRQAQSDECYLIYGDWLQERGDAFGELIALHRGMASARSAAELESVKARIAEILRANELAAAGSPPRSRARSFTARCICRVRGLCGRCYLMSHSRATR